MITTIMTLKRVLKVRFFHAPHLILLFIQAIGETIKFFFQFARTIEIILRPTRVFFYSIYLHFV